MLKNFLFSVKKQAIFTLCIMGLAVFITGCSSKGVPFIDNKFKTITIGHIESFTGDNSDETPSAKAGVDAAIAFINQGPLGRFYKFKVQELDIKSNVENNSDDFFTQEESVAAWIFPFISTDGLALKNGMKLSSVPLFFPASTYNGLTEGLAETYQLVASNETLAIYSVILANKIGCKRMISIQDPNKSYTMDYSVKFNAVYPIYNDANIIKSFSGSFADKAFFDTIVNYITDNKIDSVFLPAELGDISTFIKDLADNGLSDVKVITGDNGFISDGIYSSIGKAAPPLYFVSYIDTTFNTTIDKNMKKFFFDYIKNTPKVVPIIACLYFDAVILFATAVDNIVVDSNIKALNPKEFYTKLNIALKNLKNIPIVSGGTLTIKKDGTVDKKLVAMKVDRSGLTPLDINISL